MITESPVAKTIIKSRPIPVKTKFRSGTAVRETSASLAQKRLARLRWKSIEDTDKYLIEFEANFIRRGGTVLWARRAADVQHELNVILESRPDATLQIKNGPLCREIQPGAASQSPPGDRPERQHNTDHVVTVTEADYAVADPGGLFLAGAAEPLKGGRERDETCIVLVAVDRIIPSVRDLHLLLACPGPGREYANWSLQMAPYDGQKLVVVIVDNGRSEVMESHPVREVMRCIGCRGCETHDTVSAAVRGMHDTAGYDKRLLPYEVVTRPYSDSFSEAIGKNFMHPLDGRLSKSCPVRIDFKKLFLHNRMAAASRGLGVRSRLFYFLWKKSIMKRGLITTGMGTMNFFTYTFFNRSAGGLRSELPSAKKSFNRYWQEKMQMN